jgi:hypothetical protein
MTVIAADAFAGSSDGDTLPDHDANWVNHPGAGNGFRITNDERARGNGTNCVIYRAETPPSADYSVKADIYVAGAGVSGNAPGVCARMDTSALTYYEARLAFSSGSSANWQLYKRVAGTYTQLGSNVAQTVSTSTSYAVELRVNGSAIELYKLGEGSAAISATDSAITAAGKAGLRDNAASTNTTGYHYDNFLAETLGGGDTTAPVLSSPTGTATGSTTATVGATTDEGNGTLYAFVSTSATPPSATDLKAGTGAVWADSVAVSSTGAKTLNATGLTASTGYYAHLIHTDAAANDSNIVTSAQFTTTSGVSTLTADSGSYSISGQQAYYSLGRIALTGTYTLTGQDVTFVHSVPGSYALTAERGIYTLSGRNATLRWSGEPATINYNGNTISLQIGISI